MAVGWSRRTYRIGNAVEDIKSSSTICQSPSTGSFHLVLLFHLHFLPERRSLALDVPTMKRRQIRLLTHPISIVSIVKRRLRESEVEPRSTAKLSMIPMLAWIKFTERMRQPMHRERESKADRGR